MAAYGPLCQFCENCAFEIHWFCIDCGLKLCKRCDFNIHSKQKASKDHKKILLQDLKTEKAAETFRKADLESMTCEIHTGQKCVLFCDDCSKSICVRCSYELHCNHDHLDLNAYYNEKVLEIVSWREAAVKNFTFYKIADEKLQTLLNDSKKEYDIVKKSILNREKEIKDATTKYCNKLINELNRKYQPYESEGQSKVMQVLKKKEEEKEKKEYCDHILSAQKASMVIESRDVGISTTPEQVQYTRMTRFKFIPGISHDYKMREIFGEVSEI